MIQERLSPEFSEAQPTHVAVEAPATRRSQARVYKPVRNQVEMVMRDLDSVLPKDHLARTVWAVVESLDLSAFYAPIKAVVGEPGHPATDPQVLVALWIYATSKVWVRPANSIASAGSTMRITGSVVECPLIIHALRLSSGVP